MERFDSTCWSLVDSAAGGSRVDRESFSRQYAPLIRSYLASRWRLPVDHDQVVDGCQDVMIQLLKPRGALEGVDADRSGGFRAYLYGVSRNVALMIERTARRQRQLQAESSFDADQIEQSEATLSQAFDRAWVEMLANQARLRFKERADGRRRSAYQCLELRYLEGLKPAQIAARLERDVREVYELLRTARDEYRAALLDVMAEYHPDCDEAELERRCRELTELLQ